MSHSSKNRSSSASERKVAWWSSSTFVRTAISGRRSAIDRSDSSPSTTSQPVPEAGVPAELRHDAADDPRGVGAELAEHERDHGRGRRLAVGASDHDRPPERDELGEELGPRASFDAPEVGARDDDLETRRRLRLAADVDRDSVERLHEDRLPEVPAAHLRSPRARDVRVRGEPRSADADEVDPPALQRAVARRHPRASRRRKSHELVRDLLRSVRPGERAHRVAHPPQPLGIVEQLVHESGDACELLLAHDDCPSPALEVNRVLKLVVCRRVRVRNENRGCPGGGELPDRPARARDREVRSRQRVTEPLYRREQHVVTPRDLRPQRREVPVARDVQHREIRLAVGLDRELVQRLGAGEPAEHGEHGPVLREAERSTGGRTIGAEVVLRDGPADDAVLRAVTARDVVGEEDTACQGCGQPVCEPEVRVRLAQRRRHALETRGEHHRPGHVPPAAEDDVRSAAPQDAQARERRAHGPPERADELDPELPGEAGDGERVELEAGLRNQPRLDAVW